MFGLNGARVGGARVRCSASLAGCVYICVCVCSYVDSINRVTRFQKKCLCVVFEDSYAVGAVDLGSKVGLGHNRVFSEVVGTLLFSAIFSYTHAGTILYSAFSLIPLEW